jgi:hypothetical protein
MSGFPFLCPAMTCFISVFLLAYCILLQVCFMCFLPSVEWMLLWKPNPFSSLIFRGTFVEVKSLCTRHPAMPFLLSWGFSEPQVFYVPSLMDFRRWTRVTFFCCC